MPPAVAFFKFVGDFRGHRRVGQRHLLNTPSALALASPHKPEPLQSLTGS